MSHLVAHPPMISDKSNKKERQKGLINSDYIDLHLASFASLIGNPLKLGVLSKYKRKYFKYRLMFGLPRLTMKGNSIEIQFYLFKKKSDKLVSTPCHHHQNPKRQAWC
jgi:hypothetical protein